MAQPPNPIEIEVQPDAGGAQMLRQLADGIEASLLDEKVDTDDDTPGPVVELPFVPRRLDLPTLEALADALDSVEADDEAPAVEKPSVPERLGPPTPEELIEALELVDRAGPMPMLKFRRLDYRPRRPVWAFGEPVDVVIDDDEERVCFDLRQADDTLVHVEVRGDAARRAVPWVAGGEGRLVEVIGGRQRDGTISATAVLPSPRPTWA